MKQAIKKFVKYIPLAIGIILTLTAFVQIIDLEYGQAFVVGVLGLCLIFYNIDL